MTERRVPVTVVQGDHDIADWKGTYWTWAARQTSNIDHRTIANAGHNVWIDAPTKIREILNEKLTR